MNVQTNFKKKKATLVSAKDVPIGRVYSWGVKNISYLRVDGGSITLPDFYFLPLTASHFSSSGPRVEIAAKADLTIEYEG